MRGRRVLLGVVLLLTASPAWGAPCSPCLEAGAASVSLRVPPGTPLAGYGGRARRRLVPDLLRRSPHAFWFKPHQGQLDPVGARALVLESASARVVWVAVDLVGIDRAFRREVTTQMARAGLPPATLLVSASHTHSGPGALASSWLWSLVAVDRLDPIVRASIIESIIEAIRRADAAKVEARAGTFAVTAPRVVASRLGQPLDAEIVGIKIVSGGGMPIALVWNYAIHGTMLPATNLKLSGDVMGVTSQMLEREIGAPALFVNGAVGDVRPARHGYAAAIAVARELTAVIRVGWTRSDTASHPAIAATAARISLPPAALSPRNCLGRWVPRWLTIPLGSVLPRDAELIAVVLDDTAWVTVPGELQTRLGLTIKRGTRAFWRHVFVAGVSNDYLGYFVAATDYDRGSYVSCASLYGPEAGNALTASALSLLRSLADRRASRPGDARQLRAPGEASREIIEPRAGRAAVASPPRAER